MELEDKNEAKERFWDGFIGFLGFNGFLAFTYHEPWLLFNFCIFAAFTRFGYLKEELKYLALLAIPGFIVAILGVTGVIKV